MLNIFVGAKRQRVSCHIGMGDIDGFLGSDGEVVTFVQLMHAQTQLFWTPYMHICSGQALELSKH